MEQGKSSSVVAILAGSFIIASSIIFAGLYVGHIIKHSQEVTEEATTESAETTETTTETESEAASVAPLFISQVKEQAQAMSQKVQVESVTNVHVTRNSALMVLDFTYKTAPSAPVQTHRNLELPADEKGRFVGTVKIGDADYTIKLY